MSTRATHQDVPGDERDESPIGLSGAAASLASLIFLAAGVAWPQGAGALLRILLVTFAVGYIATRAHDALLYVRTRKQVRSPFDGDVGRRMPTARPRVLQELSRQLAAADDARRAERTGIPRAVQRTIMDELADRLAQRHALDVHDASQHARIRVLVSEATWRLITEPAHRPSVRELAQILADLESL